MASLSDISDLVHRAREQAKERAIRESLVLTEGVIPPPDVLREHGRWLCHPDGKQEFAWKGKVLVTITPTWGQA